MRQMILANRDFHIHAEIILATQNLNHPSPRILRRRRPVGDLNVHYDPLKTVPLRPPRHLVTQHSIHGFSFPLCPPCPLGLIFCFVFLG